MSGQLVTKNAMFDLSIRVAGVETMVPVYETDSDVSLAQRLIGKYPQIDGDRNRDKIKQKVRDSLKKIMNSHNIKQETKKKIAQFLEKSEIEVTICLKQSNRNKISTCETKRKSLGNLKSEYESVSKQKSTKQTPSRKQFTKLYQITKGIFSLNKKVPAFNPQKQNICSRVRQSYKRSCHPSQPKPPKQHQQQILKRIQQKLASYQQSHSKPTESSINVSIIDPRLSVFTFSQANLPSIELVEKKNPLKNNLPLEDDSVLSNNQKNRYRYNYDEIIGDRQLSQRKLLRREGGGDDTNRRRRTSFNYIGEEQNNKTMIDGSNNLRRNYFTHSGQNTPVQSNKTKLKYQYMQEFTQNDDSQGHKQRNKRRNSGSLGNIQLCRSYKNNQSQQSQQDLQYSYL